MSLTKSCLFEPIIYISWPFQDIFNQDIYLKLKDSSFNTNITAV